jgi:hypothetical protein
LYTVETYTDQELAATLGVSVAGVPVSGAPEDPIHPSATPSNQLQRNSSEEMVYEVYDSSQKLEKVSEIQNPFSEKEFHAKWYTSYTPCTPRPENHPSRVGSGFDVAIDDGDDPYWPPRQSDDMGNGRAQLRLNG